MVLEWMKLSTSEIVLKTEGAGVGACFGGFAAFDSFLMFFRVLGMGGMMVVVGLEVSSSHSWSEGGSSLHWMMVGEEGGRWSECISASCSFASSSSVTVIISYLTWGTCALQV